MPVTAPGTQQGPKKLLQPVVVVVFLELLLFRWLSLSTRPFSLCKINVNSKFLSCSLCLAEVSWMSRAFLAAQRHP